MVHRRLVFALFSAAILLSMVREWNAPVSCALRQIEPGCARRTAEAAVPTKGPYKKKPCHRRSSMEIARTTPATRAR